jgi:hypothetical protein
VVQPIIDSKIKHQYSLQMETTLLKRGEKFGHELTLHVHHMSLVWFHAIGQLIHFFFFSVDFQVSVIHHCKKQLKL